MSWTHVAIGDVVRLAREGIAPEDIAPGTVYVGLEHIDSSGGFVAVKSVDAGEIASSKFCFTRASILFGKLRPYLKKTARPHFDGVCSTDILPLEPTEKITRNYLYHVLRRQSFVDEVSSLCTGANLPRISPKVLVAMRIPLPPLAEQCRIAAILDLVDEIRAKRRDGTTKLDHVLEAVFLERFGDPIKNPKRLPQRRLRTVAAVQTGGTPPSAATGAFDGPVPFVTPGDLGGLIFNSRRTVTREGAKMSKVAPAGSTFVCCIGATIGKMGFAKRDSAFNQQINAITWGPEVDEQYGYYAMKFLADEIAHRGTSTTLPILKKSAFEELSITVATRSEQEAFGRFALAVEREMELLARNAIQLEQLAEVLQGTLFTENLALCTAN